MSEAKFSIKFKSNWNGSPVVGGEKRQYKAGDIEIVDMDTFRALVSIHGIAEARSVDEIIADHEEAKKPKESTGRRASRTKAGRPKKDKMVRDSANKGE